jgi:erythromycin esterase-like protein
LAWESGLHGMQAVDAGFRERVEPIAAAERGIFTIWSHAAEVKPLLEYASAMQGTRPLHMAGFDMQFTARNSREYLENDLRSFVGALRDRVIRERSQKLVEQALGAYRQICCAFAEARARKAAELSESGTPKDRLEQAMAQWSESEGAKLRATKEQLTMLQEATGRLMETIDTNRTAFEQVHGAREIGFMVNAVSNLAADGTGKLDVEASPAGATSATFSNRDRYFTRREERNARNLRWLIEDGYPGRKLIVWAHNIHVMDAYVEPGFQGIRVEPRPGDLKPTGSYVADWLDDQVYTIGMTTYEGDDRWVTGSKLSHITRPASISLEARLHALGKPYLFLDMRSLDGNTAHPLRKPQSLRLPAPVSDAAANPSGYGVSQVSDVTRIYDAIFYIDVMAPATRIEADNEDR